MKRARVVYGGMVHEAFEKEGEIFLASGKRISEQEVEWLPPFQPKTVFALALNYADHAKELSFQVPEEPVIFLKGPNTFIGHRGKTVRPKDVHFMHFECELAVVIGKSGKNIKKEEAYDYVLGYTIANDYAIRDYLENFYRPNLRVKNRDTCTPIGPWLVDKEDIDNPMNLTIKTYVNGKLSQCGSTSDMILSIPELIEYISTFMTLNLGDCILTGTPKGAKNVFPGDEVVTEIEGLGRLVNWIVEET